MKDDAKATPNTPRDGREPPPMVVIRGVNSTSANALHQEELTIRHFPFLIGRQDPEASTLRNAPDLALNDRRPFRLSRRHIVLERRDNTVFLVDAASRLGSTVDGAPLGKGIGGPAERSMMPGGHEIGLGGADSPYRFHLNVVPDNGFITNEETVRLGDGKIPVFALYDRLYRYTRDIFEQGLTDPPTGQEQARGFVTSLLEYPQFIEPLYAYSAVPQPTAAVVETHSLNVTLYAVKLARTLPLTGQALECFALAAFLHDVGMFDLPAALVNKRETITADEYEAIKIHALAGERRLLPIAAPADALLPAVAVGHHERIDGKGYPQGRRDLSREVELIAMVDFFEAVTHYRPQRGPVTPHEGMRMLIHLKDGLFRPSLVTLFVKAFSLFPVYSVVKLNAGEIAQVVQPTRMPLRPKVRLVLNRNGASLDEGVEIDLSTQPYTYITKDISDRIFVDNYFKL